MSEEESPRFHFSWGEGWGKNFLKEGFKFDGPYIF